MGDVDGRPAHSVPAEPIEPDAGDELPKRRPSKALVLVAGLGVVLVAGVAAAHYQPLDHLGGLMGANNLTDDEKTYDWEFAGPPHTHWVDDSDPLHDPSISEIVAGPYEHGGRFGFKLQLNNNAPVDIQLLGVEPALPGQWSGGSRLFVRDMSVTDDEVLIPAPEEFTIEAHGYAELAVVVDVRDCPPRPGMSTSIDEVTFNYRILGLTRTARVPLDHYLVTLEGLPGCRSS